MEKYVSLLEKHITENPIMDGSKPIESILEYFYWHYAEENMPNDRELRGCFEKLDKTLEMLPLEAQNELFYQVCDICIAREKLAFQKGIRVGGQWVLEMKNED